MQHYHIVETVVIVPAGFATVSVPYGQVNPRRRCSEVADEFIGPAVAATWQVGRWIVRVGAPPVRCIPDYDRLLVGQIAHPHDA